jgi:hypothetical protein
MRSRFIVRNAFGFQVRALQSMAERFETLSDLEVGHCDVNFVVECPDRRTVTLVARRPFGTGAPTLQSFHPLAAEAGWEEVKTAVQPDS